MGKLQLNYKQMGQGKDLIILHGLFGSLDNWVSLAKQWSEEYIVWIVDQRNHGKSPHSDEFSYTAMANDLANFIEDHGIHKPLVLGHSMGGKTAMEYAVQHPDSIEKLIVVDIAPVKYEVHHYAVLEALNSFDPAQVSSRKEAEEAMLPYVPEFGVRQFLLKNLERRSEGGFQWKFNLPVLEREIIPISEWDISEGQFDQPSLFIKGDRSPYILPEYASEIESKFPNYELEIIREAGHWVHAEQPKQFFELVSVFMKD